MPRLRPAFATDPLQFGRRAVALAGEVDERSAADDLRLFANSFAAGFLFVAVLIF